MTAPEQQIKLEYGYVEGWEDVVDVAFLHQLPARRKYAPVRYEKDRFGNLTRTEAGPDPISIGSVIISGTATATVAALATIIKSWLASQRTKIQLTNEQTGRTLVYEGPRLSQDVTKISSDLVKLLDAPDRTIRIHASKQKKKSTR